MEYDKKTIDELGGLFTKEKEQQKPAIKKKQKISYSNEQGEELPRQTMTKVYDIEEYNKILERNTIAMEMKNKLDKRWQDVKIMFMLILFVLLILFVWYVLDNNVVNNLVVAFS